MKKENYIFISRLEKENWWYKAKRNLFYLILKKLNRKFSAALDLGCGTGSNFPVLSQFSEKVTGIDNSEQALEFCRKNKYYKLEKMNAENLNFKSNSFDLILCSDVLEHVNAEKAIAEIARVLKPQGILVFSVPAHNYLWGSTDVISQHKKRYEKNELIRLFQNQLKIIKLSYWNFSIFFPDYFFIKMLSLSGKNKKPENTLKLIPKYLNKLLYNLLLLENKLFIKFNLPQGVSIIGLFKK